MQYEVIRYKHATLSFTFITVYIENIQKLTNLLSLIAKDENVYYKCQFSFFSSGYINIMIIQFQNVAYLNFST